MNADDTTQTNLAWRICQDDAPVLPVFSQITSRDMEIDPWYVFPVGEVESNGLTYRTQGSPLRKYNGKKVPKGLPSDHYCGTPSDFANGGTLDQVSPPVQYGGFGFPSCCNPPKAALGGMGLGGISRLIMQGAVPGFSCPTATLVPLSTDINYTWHPGDEQWWKWHVGTGGGTFKISIAIVPATLICVCLITFGPTGCESIYGDFGNVTSPATIGIVEPYVCVAVDSEISGPSPQPFSYVLRMDPA